MVPPPQKVERLSHFAAVAPSHARDHVGVPMPNFLYVDNSNIWIEGMHVAAVARGLAPNIQVAQEKDICDRSWSIDFGRLFEFAGGQQSDVGRAMLYGSRPPPNDSLWDAAIRKGFDPVVHDRVHGKEKKIDTNITADIVEDAYTLMKAGDEVTLVAGDRDYVPLAEKLARRSIPFNVVFWNHAAGELKGVATSFTNLNPHLEMLSLRRFH
jgi:uncharacterized LabA/DUF88 family protein